MKTKIFIKEIYPNQTMDDKEITQFKVYRAEAFRENSRLTVKLYYPKNPEPVHERLNENLQFGAFTLEKLLKEGYAEIANKENPIKPPSAGSLYILQDKNIIVHRRDKFAPIHKLYHSAYSGYTNSLEFVYSEKGLIETGLRETAEECLIVTRDKIPKLIVPEDSKDCTLESAKRRGLDIESIFINTENLDPTDKLEVYYEDGEHIFTTRAFLDLQWEGSTAINALQIRKLPLSVEDILPIDAEGVVKDDKFIHFNREAYFISLEEIKNKRFGTILEYPQVFKTDIKNKIPNIFVPTYEKPYLGPDKVKVINPHLWAPENLLSTCLDALAIEGYKSQKHNIELWKIKTKLEGKSLVPKEVLV